MILKAIIIMYRSTKIANFILMNTMKIIMTVLQIRSSLRQITTGSTAKTTRTAITS